MDYVTIDIHRDIVLGLKGKPRRKKSHSIFIAYRMNDPDSLQMRRDLEESIREIDDGIKVLDGKVLHGLPWANEVRSRIERSGLLVIDVTGPSLEVMFELGFAGNKPFIPIVRRQEDRDRLPEWLTAFQMPAFEETGIQLLATDVVTALRRLLPKPAMYRRPPPVPGMIVWLESRNSTMFGDSYERFAHRAQRYSLNVEQVDPQDLPSFDDLRKLLRAWTVIACMDGGPADQAGHFFLGDVAGRRRAGSGAGRGQSLQRRGVALVHKEQDVPLVVAGSVRRMATSTLTAVTVENMLRDTEPLLATYRRWRMRDVEDL
jgi:hypothetical protein